jgi:hypothetical protein
LRVLRIISRCFEYFTKILPTPMVLIYKQRSQTPN